MREISTPVIAETVPNFLPTVKEKLRRAGHLADLIEPRGFCNVSRHCGSVRRLKALIKRPASAAKVSSIAPLPSEIIVFVVFCRLRYRLTLRNPSEEMVLSWFKWRRLFYTYTERQTAFLGSVMCY